MTFLKHQFNAAGVCIGGRGNRLTDYGIEELTRSLSAARLAGLMAASGAKWPQMYGSHKFFDFVREWDEN